MLTIASYKQHKKGTIDYNKLIVTNKAVINFDPTKTTGLRNAFVRQMDIRFNNLKYAISKAIVDQDCFGLILSTGKLTTNVARRADATDPLPGPKAFAFSRNPEKMDSFMTWLNNQEKAGILKTTKINQLGSAAEESWTNLYIQDSYKRGVQRATYEMGKAGVQLPNQIPPGIQAVINTPFHIDRVGLLYTRSFSDLKGITNAMDSKISQILAQGLVDGDNPRVLAKKINDSVDGIGKTRARTLARTEIIRAHHAGMVGEYKNYGIAGVKVKAEWVTAGFNVCDKCQSLEGKIYTLAEIEGMIPFHPNCRCMALPVVDEGKVKEVDKVKGTIKEINTPISAADIKYLEKKKVKITEDAKYAGQDMNWTETFTGYKVLEEDTLFWHGSNSKIKAFRAKNTCFHTQEQLMSAVSNTERYEGNKVGTSVESYILKLPKGSKVATYSGDEIRYTLSESDELYQAGYYDFIFLKNSIPIPKERWTSPSSPRDIKVMAEYHIDSKLVDILMKTFKNK